MKETKIEWCDSTVSPTTGCEGCELWSASARICYAGRLHEGRLAAALPMLYAPSFTEVRRVGGRLEKAAGWSDLRGTDRPNKPWLNGMPRMIFVGDMGDVFSKQVPFEFLDQELLDVANSKNGRRHIWMVLTKQAQRAVQFADWMGPAVVWPPNIWLGTSITRQATVTRAAHLVKLASRVSKLFLSVEPLLEEVEIAWGLLSEFNLCIIGGESGTGARPFNIDWARKIIKACNQSGVRVPCFVKQLGSNVEWDGIQGGYGDRPSNCWPDGGSNEEVPGGMFRRHLRDPKGGDMNEWPADLRVRQFPVVI